MRKGKNITIIYGSYLPYSSWRWKARVTRHAEAGSQQQQAYLKAYSYTMFLEVSGYLKLGLQQTLRSCRPLASRM